MRSAFFIDGNRLIRPTEQHRNAMDYLERHDSLEGVGLYLNEWGHIFPLTPIENESLIADMRTGNPQARRKLIRGNFWVVVETSREFPDAAELLLDRISAGVLGLVQAAAEFDPLEHGSFPDYARARVRDRIRALTAE